MMVALTVTGKLISGINNEIVCLGYINFVMPIKYPSGEVDWLLTYIGLELGRSFD